MKNTLRALFASSTLAVVGLAVLGGVTPAMASDSEPLHVNVPFAFRAGTTLLPAGEYSVYSADSNVIMIKGAKGSAILLGSPTSDVDVDKAGITFDRDTNGYCLRTVHAWGRTSATRVPEPSTATDK